MSMVPNLLRGWNGSNPARARWRAGAAWVKLGTRGREQLGVLIELGVEDRLDALAGR